MTAPTLNRPGLPIADEIGLWQHLDATVPEPRRSPIWDDIDRAKTGDTDAFGKLFADYRQDVYYFLVRRVRSHQVAEDLASDVWVRALRRIDSLAYQGRTPWAWLSTIARNRLIDYYRCGPGKWEVPDGEVASADRPDQTAGVEDAVVANADRDQLLDAIRRLPEPQQEAIVLTYFEGMSSREASQVMGKTPDAVKALALRGRRSLAVLLKGASA